MDRDVGTQVVCAVAGAQVADREDPAGDEAADRYQRHRHVDVEDLLDEALVGVVGGVEEDQPERERDDGGGDEREGIEAFAEQGSVLEEEVENTH